MVPIQVTTAIYLDIMVIKLRINLVQVLNNWSFNTNSLNNCYKAISIPFLINKTLYHLHNYFNHFYKYLK